MTTPYSLDLPIQIVQSAVDNDPEMTVSTLLESLQKTRVLVEAWRESATCRCGRPIERFSAEESWKHCDQFHTVGCRTVAREASDPAAEEMPRGWKARPAR